MGGLPPQPPPQPPPLPADMPPAVFPQGPSMDALQNNQFAWSNPAPPFSPQIPDPATYPPVFDAASQPPTPFDAAPQVPGWQPADAPGVDPTWQVPPTFDPASPGPSWQPAEPPVIDIGSFVPAFDPSTQDPGGQPAEPPGADTNWQPAEPPGADTNWQPAEPPGSDPNWQPAEPPEFDTNWQPAEPPEFDTNWQPAEPPGYEALPFSTAPDPTYSREDAAMSSGVLGASTFATPASDAQDLSNSAAQALSPEPIFDKLVPGETRWLDNGNEQPSLPGLDRVPDARLAQDPDNPDKWYVVITDPNPPDAHLYDHGKDLGTADMGKAESSREIVIATIETPGGAPSAGMLVGVDGHLAIVVSVPDGGHIEEGTTPENSVINIYGLTAPHEGGGAAPPGSPDATSLRSGSTDGAPLPAALVDPSEAASRHPDAAADRREAAALPDDQRSGAVWTPSIPSADGGVPDLSPRVPFFGAPVGKRGAGERPRPAAEMFDRGERRNAQPDGAVRASAKAKNPETPESALLTRPPTGHPDPDGVVRTPGATSVTVVQTPEGVRVLRNAETTLESDPAFRSFAREAQAGTTPGDYDGLRQKTNESIKGVLKDKTSTHPIKKLLEEGTDGRLWWRDGTAYAGEPLEYAHTLSQQSIKNIWANPGATTALENLEPMGGVYHRRIYGHLWEQLTKHLSLSPPEAQAAARRIAEEMSIARASEARLRAGRRVRSGGFVSIGGLVFIAVAIGSAVMIFETSRSGSEAVAEIGRQAAGLAVEAIVLRLLGVGAGAAFAIGMVGFAYSDDPVLNRQHTVEEAQLEAAKGFMDKNLPAFVEHRWYWSDSYDATILTQVRELLFDTPPTRLEPVQ
ncbi:hypothetical protein GCM10009776_28600 [Microbacterium deminutum]|uniref:Uncharacterized protein n=2 Tax=Microbacterium deminutum TaxID=344164 RepID=A0ABN2R5M1_9MICO